MNCCFKPEYAYPHLKVAGYPFTCRYARKPVKALETDGHGGAAPSFLYGLGNGSNID